MPGALFSWQMLPDDGWEFGFSLWGGPTLKRQQLTPNRYLRTGTLACQWSWWDILVPKCRLQQYLVRETGIAAEENLLTSTGHEDS